MRTRMVRWMMAAGCAIACGHASSEPSNAASCVDVDVQGHRVLPYACLGTLLDARHPSGPAPLTGSPLADGSSNTRGEFNASGFAHRMGSNLGTSVEPFRPVVQYHVPLAAPSRP
jgi:hypothetical protein